MSLWKREVYSLQDSWFILFSYNWICIYPQATWAIAATVFEPSAKDIFLQSKFSAAFEATKVIWEVEWPSGKSSDWVFYPPWRLNANEQINIDSNEVAEKELFVGI